jgi:hypothetical protein
MLTVIKIYLPDNTIKPALFFKGHFQRFLSLDDPLINLTTF